MWNELSNQNDINNLMKTYGSFHDGCLVNLEYVSAAYVDEELSMGFNNPQNVRMIFQRQYQNPKTIEIKFENISGLNICPVSNTNDGIIFDTSMFFFENKIYWADCGGVELPIEDFKRTWVCAEKARWRIID